VKDADAAEFSYSILKQDRVQIFRGGRQVAVLGERDSLKFIRRIEGMSDAQAQVEMARVTGQYKFGNERAAKNRRNR
jgi:hypothetical protein